MTIIQVLLLGIVEGVTEFLPISSTAHLIVASHILGISQTEFLKSFEIIIQLGAILAVLVLYWRTLFLNFEIFKRVAVAFIPTALIGLLLYKFVKSFLFESVGTILWALFLGGFALLIFEAWHREGENAQEDLTQISYTTAALIGVFQSIAIIPGVSRAAATIVGGLLLGLRRKAIVEFSFLLAVPTMAAATGLDLVKSAPTFAPSDILLLGLGFLIAFVVALGVIRWFLHFIKSHSFKKFGMYRIAAALAFAFLLR